MRGADDVPEVRGAVPRARRASAPSGSKPSCASAVPDGAHRRASIATRCGASGSLVDAARRGSARRELDVLVGTQMIAKGHDFPAVTLVGVISADVGLGLADFRAAERTFQLLTQVAGRAGRGERPGEAIVQTLFPDALQRSAARCRRTTARSSTRSSSIRRAMRYPPHVAMVNVVVRGRDVRRGDATARAISPARRARRRRRRS